MMNFSIIYLYDVVSMNRCATCLLVIVGAVVSLPNGISKQQTTNNKQQTTNNKQRTNNNKQQHNNKQTANSRQQAARYLQPIRCSTPSPAGLVHMVDLQAVLERVARQVLFSDRQDVEQ